MDCIERLRKSYAETNKVSYPCPLCHSDAREVIHTGDRHGLMITTVICKDCSMVFQNPRPLDDWYDEFYKKFFWDIYGEGDVAREQITSASRYRQIGQSLSRKLCDPPQNILDFGTGSGGAFLGLKEVFPRAKLKGLDPSIDSVEMCREKFGVDVCQVDFKQLVLPANYINTFDLVTVVHVLEHVTNPLEILNRASESLKNGGYLYVEVPDMVSPNWTGEDFLHVAHPLGFSLFTLNFVVRAAGLSPVKIYRGLVDEWPWAVGILAKKVNSKNTDQTVASVNKNQLARVTRQFIEKTTPVGLKIKNKRWKYLRSFFGLF